MWEIQLIICRIQRREQIKTFVQRTIRFRIGFINLVQHNNWAQSHGQRFGCHEFCLWHRAFGGIHQQHNTVYHA